VVFPKSSAKEKQSQLQGVIRLEWGKIGGFTMRQKLLCLVTLAALAGSAAAQTGPDDEKKLINKLLQQQEVIAVNNVATAEEFVPDKDPNTLQVVFLTGPNPKIGVSEDGEVVFTTPDLEMNLQSKLTYEAFRRKAKRILAIKIPPPPSLP
jgi:hypothetical protein